MKPLQSVAFVGNHLPRRCGIATFTHDLHLAVATTRPDLRTGIVAMTNPGCTYDYPEVVSYQVRDETLADYAQAATVLNTGGFDVVCLQHEYGIFGGEAGRNIIELLFRLSMPIVTTLHTVLAQPTPAQRSVMRRIIDLSAKIVVMSQGGEKLLRAVHDVPIEKVEVVPHGIPEFPFCEPGLAKAALGFSGKSVILTFGLLSPSKGIETVIDAMPEIIAACPNAVYVVLGATHPNLLRDQGETYRDNLMARVRKLGIEHHVVFFNQFVDQAKLLEFISMCDVYVTPYLNEAQMTSGTLSYSFGLGKAVVSTPYWHAKELLAGGLGVLVPFGCAKAVGAEIASLLTDDGRRDAIRKRAYASSRSMTWDRTATRYVAAFESARKIDAVARSLRRSHDSPSVGRQADPELRVGHLLSMCDSTGLLQHAVHGIPNRAHGYCIDDNARALLLSCRLGGSDEPRLPEPLTTRFAAFVQHAWNLETGRFRNFMSYDRRWLEEQGSEDSHGRALWALGEFARKDNDASRRRWAAELFTAALPATESFTSPRAWAFTLLGLDAYCTPATGESNSSRLRSLLGEKLLAALCAVETEDWVWFEDELAYENGRVPQALLQTGIATGNSRFVEAAFRSLRWLMAAQTAPNGDFRPVGTESFGQQRKRPRAFDQQPVEAAAMISACLAAWRVDRNADWAAGAMQAFDWFLGCNDLGVPLVDRETGSCRDGLHSDRPNENMGAESVLSYLFGLVEIRQFKRSAMTDRKHPEFTQVRRLNSATSSYRRSGGHIGSIPVFESPDAAPSPRSRPSSRQTV